MFYIWAILVFAIDQFAKYLVRTQMDLGQSIPIWGEYFLLTSHRNSGAA